MNKFNRAFRAGLLTTALSVVATGNLQAQQAETPRHGFGRSTLVATSPRMMDLRRGIVESRTFWKEGGVVGGAATLVIGMLLFFEARQGQSPPSLLLLPPAAAISFLVGAGPGAFIGGLIPKPGKDRSAAREPVRVD